MKSLEILFVLLSEKNVIKPSVFDELFEYQYQVMFTQFHSYTLNDHNNVETSSHTFKTRMQFVATK